MQRHFQQDYVLSSRSYLWRLLPIVPRDQYSSALQVSPFKTNSPHWIAIEVESPKVSHLYPLPSYLFILTYFQLIPPFSNLFFLIKLVYFWNVYCLPFCTLLRHKCFTHETFGNCLQVLLTPATEIEQLQYFLKVINGSPLPFDWATLNLWATPQFSTATSNYP